MKNYRWLIAALTVLLAGSVSADAQDESDALEIVVMDPLALPLSCACVDGSGQRRYDKLGYFLEQQLGRPVNLTYEESLAMALKRSGGRADLIIGKRSVVEYDAAASKTAIRPIATLSDRDGAIDLRGVVLVRTDDPAKSLADLAGRKVVLGPEENAESNQAARRLFEASGIAESVEFATAGSMDAGALAVSDGEADAVVISDFLPPLFEGCGKLGPNSMRIIARTEAVPFITVFATGTLDEAQALKIRGALALVAGDAELLLAIESRDGFVATADVATADVAAGWPDWRGPGRRGFSPDIPDDLPEQLESIWTAELTGPAVAGPAATGKYVVVPDKSADGTRDVFRCFDAQTGKSRWTLDYEASGEMDYSNSPRATPVIHESDGVVYLLGAFGDLTCVELDTGNIVWELNLFIDFNADPLFWGSSAPPLIVGDKLIVNPGAEDASVVALDRHTGDVIWKAEGHAAAYSAFIFGSFDGVDQIIGYDTGSLGGWDPETGRRLWKVIPPDASDFNVTTPLIVDGGRILLATENNGARLYRFDGSGVIVAEPVATNFDFAPDTCSPVAIHGKILAAGYGEIWCADLDNDLAMTWYQKDDLYYDHSNFIAGENRVLIWTIGGDLVLLKLDPDTTGYEVVAHRRPFGEATLDSMSHPAIVGERIYLRGDRELRCLRLSP